MKGRERKGKRCQIEEKGEEGKGKRRGKEGKGKRKEIDEGEIKLCRRKI